MKDVNENIETVLIIKNNHYANTILCLFIQFPRRSDIFLWTTINLNKSMNHFFLCYLSVCLSVSLFVFPFVSSPKSFFSLQWQVTQEKQIKNNGKGFHSCGIWNCNCFTKNLQIRMNLLDSKSHGCFQAENKKIQTIKNFEGIRIKWVDTLLIY